MIRTILLGSAACIGLFTSPLIMIYMLLFFFLFVIPFVLTTSIFVETRDLLAL